MIYKYYIISKWGNWLHLLIYNFITLKLLDQGNTGQLSNYLIGY